MLSRIIVFILSVLFLGSCIKELPKTNVRALSGKQYDYGRFLKYKGIENYRIIGDTKVELDFNVDYDIANFDYIININDTSYEVIKSEDLVFRNNGYVTYTVSNLQSNEYYKIKNFSKR